MGVPFLHYFNSSFKKALHQAKLDSKIDEDSAGMHISEHRRRLQRKVIKIQEALQKEGNNPESEKSIAFIANSLTKNPREIREIIADMGQQKVQGEYGADGDDDNVSIFNTVQSNLAKPENILDNAVYLDKSKSQFDKIEEAVQTFRSDRKKLLGQILTMILMPILPQFCESKEYKKEKYSFIIRDLFEQHKKQFSEKAPTKREIAKLLKKNETEISRAIREFQDKLKTL
jgi:hypothetical protein